MTQRTRFQWPIIGDSLKLEMYNFAGNLPANVDVQYVNIYAKNAAIESENNPLGLYLVDGPLSPDTIGTGQYQLTLDITSEKYNSGEYKDIWTITYPNGSTGQRDFDFKIYPERQAAVTYPPTITWAFSMSPRKIHYDSIFRLISRVRPSEITDNSAAEHWINMLNAGTVEIKIIRTHSVYDYIACEDGGNDDVNATLPWTEIQDRGDGIYSILLDTASTGLNMYPGEYRVQYRVTYADTIWYSTEKQYLQITR